MVGRDDDRDDSENENESEKTTFRAGELMKRVLTAGVGAAFLTEEGLRALVSEVKLPKELIGGILKSAGEARREFLQNLSQEVSSRIKDKLDPSALVEEILRKNEVELTMKIRFTPKADHKKKAHKPE